MHTHRDPELDADHRADPYDQLLRAGICRVCGKPTVEPADATGPWRPIVETCGVCGAAGDACAFRRGCSCWRGIACSTPVMSPFTRRALAAELPAKVVAL